MKIFVGRGRGTKKNKQTKAEKLAQTLRVQGYKTREVIKKILKAGGFSFETNIEIGTQEEKAIIEFLIPEEKIAITVLNRSISEKKLYCEEKGVKLLNYSKEINHYTSGNKLVKELGISLTPTQLGSVFYIESADEFFGDYNKRTRIKSLYVDSKGRKTRR